MAETLTLYTNPMSRGRIARWMLEEVAAPYETVVLDYEGAMKTPEFLAVNPMGKVPAITHGDQVVTEAAAICTYLADAFPQAGLAPERENRASYYRWLFFTAGPMEQAMVNRALGFVLPEGKDKMAGYGTYDAALDALDGALSKGPYLCGDQFTAADVYVGLQVGFGLQFKSIEDRPSFQPYWDRVRERPAYLRATELDDALMPQDAG